MRSLLFVPADSERKIAKALATAPTLSSSISKIPSPPPTSQKQARLPSESCRHRAAAPKLFVRVNALRAASLPMILLPLAGTGPTALFSLSPNPVPM